MIYYTYIYICVCVQIVGKWWKMALLLKMEKHPEILPLGFFVHWKHCLDLFIGDIEMLWKFFMSVEMEISKKKLPKNFGESKLPNPSYFTQKNRHINSKFKIGSCGGRMMVSNRGWRLPPKFPRYFLRPVTEQCRCSTWRRWPTCLPPVRAKNSSWIRWKSWLGWCLFSKMPCCHIQLEVNPVELGRLSLGITMRINFCLTIIL